MAQISRSETRVSKRDTRVKRVGVEDLGAVSCNYAAELWAAFYAVLCLFLRRGNMKWIHL